MNNCRCGGPLRPTSKFCPLCGSPVQQAPVAAPPAPLVPQAVARPGGFTVAAPRPPAGAGAGAGVPRGTVIKDVAKKPGTILYRDKREIPVCGWLVVLRGRRQGRDFRIEKENGVLGRDGTCDYVIEDDTVSREHCRVRIEGKEFFLYDLGSGNGTYLNGERVYRAQLTDGDVIKIGESLVLFKDAKPRVSLEQADVPVQGQADMPAREPDQPRAP